MSLHGEQGIGGLQLLPQRLPLLLRQQRPRKGATELFHTRSDIAAAAGTSAAYRYHQAVETRIFPFEGTQSVRLMAANGYFPMQNFKLIDSQLFIIPVVQIRFNFNKSFQNFS